MPAESAYTLVAYDYMNKRTGLAGSPAWKALSPEQQEKQYPEFLRHNFGFEDWMLRHFLGPVVHISGHDVDGFPDAVLVTRLTRLGSLIERVMRWSPRFESDRAGGLRLRRDEEENYVYAVRGRALIVSRDRSAIIEALTLTPSQYAEELDSKPPPNAPMLTGFITPDGRNGMTEDISYVAFSMIVDDSSWDVAAEVVFQGKLRDDLDEALQAGSRRQMLRPMDGPIVLSLNTTSSPSRLRPIFYELTGFPVFSDAQWHEWESADSADSLAPFWTSLLARMGKQTAVTWHGFDLRAPTPMPSVTVVLSLDEGDIVQSLSSGVALPTGDAWRDRYTHYDEENRVLHAFDSTGFASRPVVRFLDTIAVAVTDSAMLDTYSEIYADVRAQTIDSPSQLYLKVNPSEAIEEWVNLGTSLAAQGLLKDHTPESFAQTAALWWERASHVQSGILTATYKEGTASLRLSLDTSDK